MDSATIVETITVTTTRRSARQSIIRRFTMCSSDLFLGLLAILFPPISVWVKRGICSADSLINIILCTLGYIPGLIHAWYIIAKYPEPSYDYESLPDSERHTTVHHFIPCNHSHGQAPQAAGYGATGQQPRAQEAPRAEQGSSVAGPSDGSVPPSYAEVIAGDNKIQH